MSDTTCTHGGNGRPLPDAWGQLISAERQTELRSILDAWDTQGANHGGHRGPFDHGDRLTGADVYWLVEEGKHRRPGFIIFPSLQGADLGGAHLEGAFLFHAHLEGAYLRLAHLNEANCTGVDLEGADFSEADLTDADLSGTHLERANLSKAVLERADLRSATFDLQTTLTNAILISSKAGSKGIGPCLADVRFNGLPLIVLTEQWEQVRKLADEVEADEIPIRQRDERRPAYAAAGRAYRLLSTALRDQGLTALATRFHYRAESMDRKALWHRGLRSLPAWFISWLLGTLAGYGDYVSRLFLTYGAVVLSFAVAMLILSGRLADPAGLLAGHLPSLDALGDALILSVTSFHGRGVQPPGLHLNDALAALSGAEAVFGLLIEGLFIAAFTRRVTGG